jgi:hypothetical protein
MEPFLFRCPRTGLNVQGIAPQDQPENATHCAVKCIACGQVHLVNLKTGRTESDEPKSRPRA